MKKKRQVAFPRAILKNLADEIKKMAGSNEGRLFILEMVEEIPYDIRAQVIEGLSAFYEDEIVEFFQLLKAEYGSEMESLCARALEKFSMAGLDISSPIFFQGSLLKAYATCSRHTGRLSLDIAWKASGKGVHVESFYLTFNADGLHSFFLVENMPLAQFEHDRQVLGEMVELSFDEASLLISQAFALNLRHMSRPSVGRFLYQKYLSHSTTISEIQERELLHRISPRLTPRQLVNSFFYALKYQDLSYILSLISTSHTPQALQQFDGFLKLGKTLLEGQVEEVYASGKHARVIASSLGLKDHELEQHSYCFYLVKVESGHWSIVDIQSLPSQAKTRTNLTNPLEANVFCRVYEITDMDEFFLVLDKIDNIREMEELPYGIHMRLTCFEDNFNHGVSFFTGVIADMIINGDEFVVISREQSTVAEIHKLFISLSGIPVIYRGEYEVSLLKAYRYLGGNYVYFEDVLVDQEGEQVFDDGMRFISARYLVKDYKKVWQRMGELSLVEIETTVDYRVYYQLEDRNGAPAFFAEYILGPNWLSISAFGELDLNQARQSLEKEIYEYLEYDGMELKTEGFFDILSSEISRENPGLEKALKEMYLNKWYNSHLSTLSGMSPSEASQSEEGKRLLWTMFKKIGQREKKGLVPGQQKRINLKEYMRKVEQGKEGKI
ncbi:MAG: hypothetical protein PHG94_06695 [Syntrophomonas sp.]|uniref:Uncharacterized protein n=1 Tax=Syntrophomonas wolfei subsp. wolfei (strain DSM 2245B / Goettingen) TaxID=335541 RepID=Q0AV14_SYNWW|nr:MULTISPECIES: hypothetical protein [Syntrophomonas]ABI69440.1 hypothetical protein Swol_2149 [Syntrophomonas wolfei subsp. wolfei str. Goettingen G311]MDD2510797.1 hypothetical protein [Syntrophomonas sp.]MDD4627216.1 hypothetical protein [Syntrophomonas sp.]